MSMLVRVLCGLVLLEVHHRSHNIDASQFPSHRNNRDVKITGRRWFGASAVDTTKTRCSDKKNDLTLPFAVWVGFAGPESSTRPLNHIGLRDADKQTDKQTNRQTDKQTDAGLALKRRKTVPNGQ
jgi:hypothetical protein